MEQIVDISPPGVGLGQGSSSSAGPADEDFIRVFRTFLRGKKVRVPPRVRVRSCPGSQLMDSCGLSSSSSPVCWSSLHLA